MFCALLRSRYQVSVYRTNGPLVLASEEEESELSYESDVSESSGLPDLLTLPCFTYLLGKASESNAPFIFDPFSEDSEEMSNVKPNFFNSLFTALRKRLFFLKVKVCCSKELKSCKKIF